MDAYASLVRAYQPVAIRVAHVICGVAGMRRTWCRTRS